MEAAATAVSTIKAIIQLADSICILISELKNTPTTIKSIGDQVSFMKWKLCRLQRLCQFHVLHSDDARECAVQQQQCREILGKVYHLLKRYPKCDTSLSESILFHCSSKGKLDDQCKLLSETSKRLDEFIAITRNAPSVEQLHRNRPQLEHELPVSLDQYVAQVLLDERILGLVDSESATSGAQEPKSVLVQN